MIRTTIFLPQDVHAGLKHLAVERQCSMAELLREAVEDSYKQDLSDMRAARKAWAAHSQVGDKAVPARDYFAKRSKKRA